MTKIPYPPLKIFFKSKYFTPINFNKKYVILMFLIKNYTKN